MTIDEALKQMNFYSVYDVMDFLEYKENNATSDIYITIYSFVRALINKYMNERNLHTVHDVIYFLESEESNDDDGAYKRVCSEARFAILDQFMKVIKASKER